jgi:hypothetical protein
MIHWAIPLGRDKLGHRQWEMKSNSVKNGILASRVIIKGSCFKSLPIAYCLSPIVNFVGDRYDRR